MAPSRQVADGGGPSRPPKLCSGLPKPAWKCQALLAGRHNPGFWGVWETQDPGPSQLEKRAQVTPRVPKLAPGRRDQCVHGRGDSGQGAADLGLCQQ